jgi:fibronectin type 3 domain-containing protein
MKHIIGIHFSIAFYFLVGLLGVASFTGCADNRIIPANKIADANGRVTISWSEVPEAVSYNIYFSRTAELTKWNSPKIPSASSPITVTDLVLGKTYYFGISVIDPSGESSILSEKAYTAIDRDGSIHFSELSPEIHNLKGQVTKARTQEGQVTLSWDNVPNALSYNIYYSESPGVTKQKGKKIANAKSPHTIKGLKRGKMYYFVVTSVANSGESKESEEVSFIVK